MAANTIARLLMLSDPAVSGLRPVSIASRNSAITLAWPRVCAALLGGSTSIGSSGRKNPSLPATILASNLASPSHNRVPLDPTIRHDASQLVLAPSALHEPR